MAQSNPGSGNGPSTADVADYLIELGREWGGQHTITISPDRGRNGIPRLFLVLKHKPAYASDQGDKEVRAWDNFPNPDSRTLASTMYRLCFELGEKLHKRRLEREAQTSF